MSDDIDRLAMELQHEEALKANDRFDYSNDPKVMARAKAWQEKQLKKIWAKHPEDYAEILAYERIHAAIRARRKHIKAVLMASLVPRCPF